MTLDSFRALRPLPGGTRFFSLPAAEANGAGPLARLPYSTRVLAENVLRHENGRTVTAEHVRALARRDTAAAIPFHPERVLLQDASGIPVLADLVALAERAAGLGLDPASVAPRKRMDLVVDHALELDTAGSPLAAATNLDREYARHAGRYRFLRWAQTRFPGLRVVPPGIGICHQLNLEVLADVVTPGPLAGFDSVVGTDSHTTMINGLSVAGWGAGGIEATAAALGEPLYLRVPEVVGVRLTGTVRPGVLATDVALTLAALLRTHGVVQRIVEFHGPGLAGLAVPDRATIANMAPEYGATMAYFPADTRTLDYLSATGRPAGPVRDYLAAQGMLYGAEPDYDDVIELDLATVDRTLAGPSRPHQPLRPADLYDPAAARPGSGDLPDGAVVIAAITSCTITSNPRAMAAAGLLARNAVARGLAVAPWTKTSLTPGSQATADLLATAGLQPALDELGFQVAGFGCGTCMGNSGPLRPDVARQIEARDLAVSAVLSGNRNFPGRIHPDVRNAYLASPPLVVAFALAGRTTIDLDREPLGTARDGNPVLLADLWPAEADIDAAAALASPGAFSPMTTDRWQRLPHPDEENYQWEDETGTIRRPPFADAEIARPVREGDIRGARPLLVLGDGITTDHISPVSRILPDSAAGQWLAERGVAREDLGTYSSRRLNHEVMLRGGFANPRLRNELAGERPGGWTRLLPDGDLVPVHVAAAAYAERGTPAVVVAGHSYGAGSARDWAAKVTRLLGVQAVLARSFERIHRTNLVALGVLPVECPELGAFDGSEEFDVLGLEHGPLVNAPLTVVVRRGGRAVSEHPAVARVDTGAEDEWMRAGGLLARLLKTAQLSHR
ncbi:MULTISPECIES: aconitate hydratase AcnA [unclassified Amycolatopsis]|uniref:aconitate hydratase AcnA n=1 Tax=unclassified Amycolatopsis TaxID=2618356 RepID=UPI00106DD3ED|nr:MULTISPECIES: aconitate hydratase AcnA [unclassified Amycolatopsis]